MAAKLGERGPAHLWRQRAFPHVMVDRARRARTSLPRMGEFSEKSDQVGRRSNAVLRDVSARSRTWSGSPLRQRSFHIPDLHGTAQRCPGSRGQQCGHSGRRRHNIRPAAWFLIASRQAPGGRDAGLLELILRNRRPRVASLTSHQSRSRTCNSISTSRPGPASAATPTPVSDGVAPLQKALRCATQMPSRASFRSTT